MTESSYYKMEPVGSSGLAHMWQDRAAMEKQDVQTAGSGMQREQSEQTTKSEAGQTEQCRRVPEKADPLKSNGGSVSLHRAALCRKRLSHGAVQKIHKLRTRQKFASPTDTLLSPCSQKLNQHRAKLFVAKSKPTKLNFATKRQRVSGEEDF
ncbi:hypothetical protein HG536_0A01220 [Torulaspora globosa]|uniref:Uncharacterized protein n=1 Tax=Torulaspora globosa TaxID=48254 RepID=A0A7G3Z9W9_9SACH|nr:uncharacterized protein HG536_0A01220 [Torulaspora globosa]QLL30305.1 hypothetical protein HG536_0A01220 [Torulaspora globosa]